MTRVGASQVFFNVVAGFNARKLIHDHRATMTVMKAVTLDSFEAMLKPVEDLTMGIGLFVNELKQVTIEMGKAQVEFEKFYSGADANILAEELKGVGLEFAKVGTEALAAGSRAAQVGAIVGNENIPFLVRQAEILSNISDLTSEEAMKGIIKLQQQTGVLYGDLSAAQFDRLTQLEKEALLTEKAAYALDALNTIANRSVAVEGELVEVMTNFSAQGALVNETFHDMAAMSAVLLEAGEEAGAAGRALRMIYARMGGDINGSRTQLEQMGFQIRDSNGDMLTMTEILKGLVAKGWNEFTPAVKQNIAQTIAGNRHYVRFIKLMENQARAVELAEDGLAGYDSAAEQAKTAMEALAYQMEAAEARSENLKAALGETLLPFQIGAQKAKNDILEMQVGLTNMFGPGFGEGIGRMIGMFQYMGGFLRFGLGVHTMAIGMQMFDAVQRDLHGILIANEHLHSKQATHLDYGVKATEEQEFLLGKIRYQYQRINAARESSQAHLLNARMLESEILNLGMRQVDIEERMATMREDEVNKSRELSKITLMRNSMFDKRLSMQTAVDRSLAANLDMKGHELSLEKQFQTIFNANSVKQEAYNKMVVIRARTMQMLNADEIAHLKAKKRELHEEHTILQTLLEENERIRGLQLAQGTRATAGDGTGGQGSVYGSVNKASIEALMTLMPKLHDMYREDADLHAELSRIKKEERTDDQQADFRRLNKVIPGYNALVKVEGQLVNGKKEHIMLNRQAHAMISRLNAENIKHQIHYDNLIIANDSLNTIKQEEIDIMRALEILQTGSNEEYQELATLLQKVIPLEKELAEAVKAAAKADEGANIETKKRVELEKQLKRARGLNNQQQKEYNKIIAGKTEELVGKQRDGFMRLGMAMNTVGATILPMISKNANGATAATMLMVTSLMPAFGQLKKAITDVSKAQYQLLMSFRKGEMSGKAFAGSILMAVGPLLAFTTAMFAFNKEAEKSAKIASEMDGYMSEHANLLSALRSDTALFGDDADYMAKKTGLYGVTINDLKKDSELLASTVKTLNQEYPDLDANQKSQLENARNLANALDDIVNGMDDMLLTQMQLDAYYAAREMASGTGDAITDFFENTMDFFNDTFQAGVDLIPILNKLTDGTTDNQKAMQELNETGFNIQYDEGAAMFIKDSEAIVQEAQRFMKEGKEITEDQLAAIKEIVDNDIYLAIEKMNSMVVTDATLEEILTIGDDAANSTKSGLQDIGDSIQNLTEDIYDFGNAREELFFGGKYGNVTGSLYKQVVKQGVGTLYNKMDIVMTNNFNGFFNEREAAERIIAVLNDVAPSLNAQ